MKPCHFCGTQVEAGTWNDERGIRHIMVYHCAICGTHGVSFWTLKETESSKFAEERTKIAAVLAERRIHADAEPANTPVVTRDQEERKDITLLRWSDLLGAFPRTIPERIERATANLARLSRTPGEPLFMEDRAPEGHRIIDMRAWGAVLFGENERATDFMKNQMCEAGIINIDKEERVILTAKGWGLVAEAEKAKGNKTSKVAFVAMWFDPGMDKTYDEGLKVGIKKAGYDAVRVDTVPSNGRIDDKIVADIRRCRFVVVDVTGHRPSVYWEAGFAFGLGIPVIYTCREDHMKDCAFDTRQYPHIVWKDHADLSERLSQWIGATIL